MLDKCRKSTEKTNKNRLKAVSLSLASKLHLDKEEVKAIHVKKGTLFDDESIIVRQGTEPSRLIAKATGLEA